MSRESTITEAFEIVSRSMKLRRPQREALKEFKDLLLRLPDKLSNCSRDVRLEHLKAYSEWVHNHHPTLTISLATGVGKTRLAGAIMALLWRSGESKHFLILAPRKAVLRRFQDALNPDYREFIFINPKLVPQPIVVTQNEIDDPFAVGSNQLLSLNLPVIYLLSPQLISTSKRFKEGSEHAERSALEHLQSMNDLVVIVDEAHHVGKLSKKETAAWSQAIRDLSPAMQIGLTATPRSEEGVNLLYNYTLKEALAEGIYTKKVHIIAKKLDHLPEDEIDHITIDFALQRLLEKQKSAENVNEPPFPKVKPIAVLFARDTAHADSVYKWLIDTERAEVEEVYLTHSHTTKSEEQLDLLINIEATTEINKIRIVINVAELTEGWDVSNVYVIAPLRTMATFTGALQAMGRGLRLPAGKRVGFDEIDTLDLICFGKESLRKIADEATSWMGDTPDLGGNIAITSGDDQLPTSVSLQISVARDVELSFNRVILADKEVSINIAPEAISSIHHSVVEKFELSSVSPKITGSKNLLQIDRDRFIQATAARVIHSLNRYLSDVEHLPSVINILEKWLKQEYADAISVPFDPSEVAEIISGHIRRSIQLQKADYNITHERRNITPQSFPVFVNGTADTISVDSLPRFSLDCAFIPRYPYGSWQRCVHIAATFDSRPEAIFAKFLDDSTRVVWWWRNSPFSLSIPTPAGNYHPDFIAQIEEEDGRVKTVLFEVKSDDRWLPKDTPDRIKIESGLPWTEIQNSIGLTRFSFYTALESDITNTQVNSLDALLPRLKPPYSVDNGFN